ncbi:DUF3780 domain-containing protein [Verminephrobacter aporrectodeae subsp. tuberculatae]|uniref:DUF3780 domain-containing protein n=1 Tax=Verminephrobacter aporrectodeae subsp. tuberculatae TaxID=1110392 RepID=A0ABT3KYP3_9BURK|nr:DUF3780 domain-containing protein [Verminephrobacter aporrectodeae]MCW5323453.1 DUF3780 domain-containing protein [Verminephrobacter aporrectodeae subsp. tuberculatae]
MADALRGKIKTLDVSTPQGASGRLLRESQFVFNPHHFKIIIPKASSCKVQISEHLGLQAASNDNAVIDRVLLDRPRRTAIRAGVQRVFNARPAAHGIRPEQEVAQASLGLFGDEAP